MLSQNDDVRIPDYTVDLPLGFTATFRWDGGMQVGWDPNLPPADVLEGKRQRYAAARQSLGGQLMGDPAPGHSALDQRGRA